MIKNNEHLKREVGVIGLSANIVNIIIGSGIFVLPATIAALMGPSSIIAYLFCGLLMALVMLCFAEAGSKVNTTGGPYTYIETAFGDYAGFIAGCFAVSSNLFADAAVSNALVDIITSAYPNLNHSWFRLIFLFTIFFGLGFINVIGIKQGIGLVKLNTLLKILPLSILIIFGLPNITFSNLTIDSLPDLNTLGQASLILFFAFQGCETGIIVGGEVTNPKRTIPKAVLVSITTVLIFYILLQTVGQGVLGSEFPNYEAAPLAETAKVVLGTFGFLLLTVGAVISMFGNMTGSVLNSPRIVYALSRDNVIPIKMLSKIHKTYATPYIAIIVYVLISFTLTIFGSFKQAVIIATSSMLLLYLGVAISVIKLRQMRKTQPDEFKIPGGLTVPALSILIIFYFLSNLALNEIIGTIAVIIILSLVFLIIKFFRNKKRH
ncbi:APC family permease [Aestuariibaculum suncheonense]|uniref:Amino acid permease n=1 Tax=Aestuariibaculum suncheonense TaxID=1028745 RepID=A0A8J6Q793_9FLAO|nr:APC family permease [Aestuariibaculum suncheonense]MBD0834895.1 amino acid permease [Aestuariibaculum suncheonense]